MDDVDEHTNCVRMNKSEIFVMMAEVKGGDELVEKGKVGILTKEPGVKTKRE